MKQIFADTFYWVALINPKDDWHQRAREVTSSLKSVELVTTDEIFVEVLNFQSAQGAGSVLDIINPVAWIKNLAGGGEMQRDRLAIADIEVKAATLEAARAELERQREEEKVNLEDKVLRLVLDYEAATRRVKLIESQLQSFNVSREVFRIRYRLGEGTTEQLLGVEERGDRLNEQLVEVRTEQDGAVRELVQLTGLEETN